MITRALFRLIAIGCALHAASAAAGVQPRAEKGDAVIRANNVTHAGIYVGWLESDEIDPATGKWWRTHAVIQARGTDQLVCFDSFDEATDAWRFLDSSDDDDYWGARSKGAGPRNMHGKQDFAGNPAYMSRAVRDNIVAEAKMNLGKPFVFTSIWSPTGCEPRDPAGARPDQFRCDGLMLWCYERAGFDMGSRSPTITPLARGAAMTLAATSTPVVTAGITNGSLGRNNWYTNTPTAFWRCDDASGSQACFSGPEYIRLGGTNYQKSPYLLALSASGVYVLTNTFYVGLDFAGYAAVCPTTLTVRVDLVAPQNPTQCVERHGIVNDTWQSFTNAAIFEWSGATDNVSGVAAYRWYFGANATGAPVIETVSNRCAPPAVAPGIHYFRIATVDGAGHQAAAQTLFTFRYREATDLDVDGMPDAWEITYGLNPATNDAADDLDHDGLPNSLEYTHGTQPNAADSDGDRVRDGDEWIAGTSPTDRMDYPKLEWSAGALAVRVYSVTGRVYAIDHAGGGPGGPLGWQGWQTNQPGTGGALNFPVTNPAAAQFYRLRIERP